MKENHTMSGGEVDGLCGVHRGKAVAWGIALGVAVGLSGMPGPGSAAIPPGSMLLLGDSFETDTVGNPPAGWSVSAPGGSALVSNLSASDGTQSLDLFNGTANNATIASTPLSQVPAPPDMKIGESFDWNYQSANTADNLIIGLVSGTGFQILYITPTQGVYEWNRFVAGGFQQVTAATTTDTWYRATLTFGPTRVTNLVDLVITRLSDNATIATYSGFNYEAAPGGFTAFSAGINRNGAAAGDNVLIDNIVVYAIPEPATAVCALLGGLGLVALRRRK